MKLRGILKRESGRYSHQPAKRAGSVVGEAFVHEDAGDAAGPALRYL